MEDRLESIKTYKIISPLNQNSEKQPWTFRVQDLDYTNKEQYKIAIWDNTLERLYPLNGDRKDFRIGNLIKIIDSEPKNTYGNYLINTKFEVVEYADMPGLNNECREKEFLNLDKYINLINNDKLKRYINGLLSEHAEEFKKAPGSKTRHHCYTGGLLIHTLECLEYARTLIPILDINENDKDALYAACILHDFGKIFEYTIDMETSEISINSGFYEEWINHSQWGYSKCMSEGFSKIAKMVATHHARTEWGAVIDLDKDKRKSKEELEPIYYIMHHIDDLSAKFGKSNVLYKNDEMDGSETAKAA